MNTVCSCIREFLPSTAKWLKAKKGIREFLPNRRTRDVVPPHTIRVHSFYGCMRELDNATQMYVRFF